MNSNSTNLDKKNLKKRLLQSTISTSFPRGIRISPTGQTLGESFVSPQIKDLVLEKKGEISLRTYKFIEEEVETLSAQPIFRGTKLKSFRRKTPEIFMIGRPDARKRFLENIKIEAIKNLKKCFEPRNINVEFSHAYKIKETLIDSYYIGHLYGLDEKNIHNALTGVLLANEGVYALDDVYDNDLKPSENVTDALNRQQEMYNYFHLFLMKNNKGNLWKNLISVMYTTVQALWRMEKIRDINDDKARMILDVVGENYGYFFKPSDEDYLDIGAEMTMFLKLNREGFGGDLEALRKYCNASRRITDIGDAFIDLRKDIRNHILSPFGSYTYSMCSQEERNILLKTVASGFYTQEMEKILQAYGQRVTQNNIDYILSVPTNSEKAKSVQERFCNLGDIILEMTEDIRSGKLNYDDFYKQTLSDLMIFP